jgi:hypothetical protein
MCMRAGGIRSWTDAPPDVVVRATREAGPPAQRVSLLPAVGPGLTRDVPGGFLGAMQTGWRDRGPMTLNTLSEIDTSSLEDLALLDMADVLDLLAAVSSDHVHRFAVRPISGPDVHLANLYALDGEPHGIVGHALFMAQVSVEDLESMTGWPLRDLYRDGRLPIPFTLGALIVLDAAQRSQDRGRGSADLLDDATAAAARFLDLVSVVPEVRQWVNQCRGRSPIRSSTRLEHAAAIP